MKTQIDWISAIVEFEHDPDVFQTDKIMCIDNEGEIKWITQKALQVEGSHAAKTQIKPIDLGRSIHISGNPTKFLQGHNIFGIDDLRVLLTDWLARVRSDGHLGPCERAQNNIASDVRLTRVDLCRNYDLGNKKRVNWFIETASKSCTMKYRGTGIFKPGTVYWKGTKSFGAKIYGKAQELKAHPLPRSFPYSINQQLTEHAQGLLRIEFMLRTRDLDRYGLTDPGRWSPNMANLVFDEHLQKLHLGDAMSNADALEKLPPRAKAVYKLWENGESITDLYSRATFYRYRREILDATGQDIAALNTQEPSNVVPLIRVLEAAPVEVPVWASEIGLIHRRRHLNQLLKQS